MAFKPKFAKIGGHFGPNFLSSWPVDFCYFHT